MCSIIFYLKEREKVCKLIGYHGTFGEDIISVMKNILDSGFILSDKENEWLGRGIYFFDNDAQAKWWGKEQCKKNKIFKYGIIKAVISYEKILDLDNLDDRKKYEEACYEYSKEIAKRKPVFKDKSQAELLIQCLFLSMYKDRNNIDVIKKTFNLEKKEKQKYNVLTKTHIQYCVSKEKNISNKCIHYSSVN